MSRYPENWNEIAFKVKETAQWKCSKCGLQCLKPSDDVSKLSKSQRMRKTLTVHHSNYLPWQRAAEEFIVVDDPKELWNQDVDDASLHCAQRTAG